MSAQSQYKIEELLEQIGSNVVQEEIKHRHALRRCLLSSKYFAVNASFKRRVFLLAIPFFASGLLITIFIVMHSTPANVSTPVVLSPAEPIADAYVPSFSTNGLVAKYIDDRPMIPADRVMNTVSFHPTSFVLSQ